MIAWLRRVLGSAPERTPADPPEPPGSEIRSEEFDRRLESARRRLKETIPPQEE